MRQKRQKANGKRNTKHDDRYIIILVTMAESMLPSLLITFVGDSDIDRWPNDLLPSIEKAEVTVHGSSGATLRQILPTVEACLCGNRADRLVLVVCAGENDIGDSIPLPESEQSLKRLLEITFNRPDADNTHLIFLGPKFEPWLHDDPQSRKQYVQMARAFERCCRDFTRSSNVTFVDCLGMFCGESGNQPGAVLGGRAVADPRYFHSDQLHLSADGYRIWKDVVEHCIGKL
jgi:lysophospholipase L1-like esterase